jgi:spoIIIJ-associated protein
MEAEALIEKTLSDLLAKAGIVFSGIEKQQVAGQTILSIQSDNPSLIIGPHGDTIYAIDTIVKKMVEHSLEKQSAEGEQAEEPMFLVDVGGYRTQKIKDIETKALMMADRARSFQYDVELSPMSAYERLIVHTVLSEQPNIKTESQGEGRGRRVVIRYVAA